MAETLAAKLIPFYLYTQMHLYGILCFGLPILLLLSHTHTLKMYVADDPISKSMRHHSKTKFYHGISYSLV